MKELLKEHNLKVTNNRLEILDIIEKLDLDATIKNILNKTNIDKSTVYRIVEILLNNNILETSINHKNELYYQIKHEHKHYIRCIKCHDKQEIDICPVEEIEKAGYKIISHKIEIDGICNKCTEKE